MTTWPPLLANITRESVCLPFSPGVAGTRNRAKPSTATLHSSITGWEGGGAVPPLGAVPPPSPPPGAVDTSGPGRNPANQPHSAIAAGEAEPSPHPSQQPVLLCLNINKQRQRPSFLPIRHYEDCGRGTVYNPCPELRDHQQRAGSAFSPNWTGKVRR